MIQQTPQAELIRRQLSDSLRHEFRDSRIVKIAKHNNVYTCGEVATCSIYLIESGQVKLLPLSREGKECIVAIHTAGDVFGESCLSGEGERVETATAMEETELRVISCPQFCDLLRSDSLLARGFVRYLSVRVADQQEAIAHLVTDGCEHRLGTILLELARRLGKKDRRDLTIEHRISQEELSHMVGTTRPRVSEFMRRFRKLGLIETRAPNCLVVRDKNLSDYLNKLASCGLARGCGVHH
jgi:CRP/FNR family cyclic AMP-dependent transcriptional regulator